MTSTQAPITREEIIAREPRLRDMPQIVDTILEMMNAPGFRERVAELARARAQSPAHADTPSNCPACGAQTGSVPVAPAHIVASPPSTGPHPLYTAALDADAAWQAELVRVYHRDAGDARYDGRGIASSTLTALRSAKLAADVAWRDAMRGTTS